MATLVAVETVLLVLLLLLVAGLLRSHAEVLRRLGPAEGDAPAAARSAASPASDLPGPVSGNRWRDGAAAPVLAGATLSGDAVKLAFEGGAVGPTLLAFLTSGCSTCAGFWAGLGDSHLPAGVQPVIVTRGRDRESPSRLRTLAPPDVPVVMSSQAWDDYAVPGAPYFVLVDGGVRGEGVATAWPALASLVSDAIADQQSVPRAGPSDGRPRGIDETFAAAGISPEDPSLYPAGAGASGRGVGPAERTRVQEAAERAGVQGAEG